MEKFDAFPILAGIDSPRDLKALPEDRLAPLAQEIREYLTLRVGENGGHLASNLGVVELTMAIHRVFDAPKDHIVFDVGHQSYVHKLLTGRKERFDTLRAPGGLSGFTKRAESEYDAFGAGHSSTAVSAALGLAEADALSGDDAYTVAVIGDGALTGGLSYEGLNNCRPNLRLILIINENEMSISPNTGRLAGHLSKIRASHKYIKTKELAGGALRHFPVLGKPTYRLLRWFKRRVKHLFYHENLFEHMGIRYLGPVESTDVQSLEVCLRHAKRLRCSVILHVKTKKGKGYAPAEENPNAYHALPEAGKPRPAESFSQVFGKELVQIADADERICAITAAMSCGTGLESFRKAYPDRFFDVGIAEGHALTFAAGLAAGGKRPVVAMYSTFLQRAFDNLVHDVALQGLPLVLCVDRAGLNEGDGATHHGVFDISMVASLPGVKLYTPICAAALTKALREACGRDALSVIRYPAGGESPALTEAFYREGAEDAPLGVRVYGSRDAALTVVTHGRIAAEALAAAHTLEARGVLVRVLLCEYLAPFDRLAAELAPLLCGRVIFLEEEIRSGGFGMHLSDALIGANVLCTGRFEIIAAPHGFVVPRAGETVFSAAGVDAAAIIRVAEKLLEREGT